MKKASILLSIILTGLFCNAQTKSKFNYKVGLVASLPTDTYAEQSKIAVGSTIFEGYYVRSSKVDLTMNAGYLRYTNGGEAFAQVFAMPGARYKMDNLFHFGCNLGGAIYNRSDVGKLDFMFSPFIGLTANKITIDIRYFNTVKGERSIKTNAITFLYTL